MYQKSCTSCNTTNNDSCDDLCNAMPVNDAFNNDSAHDGLVMSRLWTTKDAHCHSTSRCQTVKVGISELSTAIANDNTLVNLLVEGDYFSNERTRIDANRVSGDATGVRVRTISLPDGGTNNRDLFVVPQAGFMENEIGVTYSVGDNITNTEHVLGQIDIQTPCA